jgi:single-stranded DNA-binding protein
MNTINLTGRLTQDPELRELPSGEHACRMRLAVDGMGRGGRDQVGERRHDYEVIGTVEFLTAPRNNNHDEAAGTTPTAA